MVAAAGVLQTLAALMRCRLHSTAHELISAEMCCCSGRLHADKPSKCGKKAKSGDKVSVHYTGKQLLWRWLLWQCLSSTLAKLMTGSKVPAGKRHQFNCTVYEGGCRQQSHGRTNLGVISVLAHGPADCCCLQESW